VPDVQEYEGRTAARRFYDGDVEEELTACSEKFLEVGDPRSEEGELHLNQCCATDWHLRRPSFSDAL
jgi:hypothetical protein